MTPPPDPVIDYTGAAYHLDEFGGLWRGPCSCPDTSLQYLQFRGVEVEDGKPVRWWDFEPCDPAGDLTPITPELAARALAMFDRDALSRSAKQPPSAD